MITFLIMLTAFDNPVPIFANKDNDIAEPHKAKPRHTDTEAGQYSTTVTGFVSTSVPLRP